MEDAKEAQPTRVLLVEDSVGFAYGVRDMLLKQSKTPFSVLHAGTLEGALEFLKSSSVDVVLLDLGLPDSKRLDTFERVHARAPNLPVVILTVLDDDELAIKALREGGQDYLVKDRLTTEILIKSIRYAVERSAIERELRQLSARVLALQDEERRRIARTLHDVTGQNLAVLSMNLSLLMKREPAVSREERALLSEASALAKKCSDDLRTTAYLLHPPMLEELGLAGAVRDYADGFAQRSGIRVDLELPPRMPPLTRDMEIALFRVMQECLTNIHRHSGSRTASISFSLFPGGIRLEVGDTGNGLLPSSAHASSPRPLLGVGIAGMRERLLQLGGRLEIEAEPGRGTTVRAVLPLKGDVAS